MFSWVPENFFYIWDGWAVLNNGPTVYPSTINILLRASAEMKFFTIPHKKEADGGIFIKYADFILHLKVVDKKEIVSLTIESIEKIFLKPQSTTATKV